MELHVRLRTLAEQLGPEVFGDADGLRGAIDDFLAEGDATAGEINLLIDAVRMSALNRLLTMLEHGAEPAKAVVSAGDGFARERGTEDLDHCRWACAVLGYAVGALPEPEVMRYRSTSTPDQSARSPETTVVDPAGAQPGEPAAMPVDVPDAPSGDVENAPPAASRRSWLPALAVAIVTALVVGGAAILAAGDGGDDDPPDPGGSTDSAPVGPRIPDDVLVARSLSGTPSLDQILTVEVDSGKQRRLTQGVQPAISPDRQSVAFLRESAGGSARPYLLTVGSDKGRELMPSGSDCTYSDKPAFSPDGARLALVCEQADGTPVGLYVVELDGSDLREVETPGVPVGAPTWQDETTVVYAQLGEGSQAATSLWSVDVESGEAEQLTDSARSDSNPDWSSERQLLIFQRSKGLGEFGSIFVMVPGGQETELYVGFRASDPVWSPSGDEFAALVASRIAGAWSITVMSTDNPTTQRAVGDLTYVADPDWGSQ